MQHLSRQAPLYFQLCRRLLLDKRVPKSAKAVLLGAGAFAVSPINLPNFIPFVGLIDDIGIALFAWNYFLKQVPPDVLSEHRAAVGLKEEIDGTNLPPAIP
jgi:uncharacterized membrane protein YkvA (DUF1232 family)